MAVDPAPEERCAIVREEGSRAGLRPRAIHSVDALLRQSTNSARGWGMHTNVNRHCAIAAPIRPARPNTLRRTCSVAGRERFGAEDSC